MQESFFILWFNNVLIIAMVVKFILKTILSGINFSSKFINSYYFSLQFIAVHFIFDLATDIEEQKKKKTKNF